MNKSKFFSVLFLAIAGTSAISSAQEIDWTAESITITTETQLRELAQRVNGTGGFEPTTFEEQTFVLANDIALTGGNWEPIGRSAAVSDAGPWDSFFFEGTFDGNGKVVSNVIIKGDILLSGFFGYIGKKGYIKNLGVHIAEYDVSKSWGNAYAAGIAGINNGTIEKCFATGDIKAGTTWNAYVFVGGLVGSNSGIISECYATGNVHAFSPVSRVYVGGLVGATWGDPKILDGKATIINSYATGNVSVGTNSSLYMGGLIGDNGYNVATTIVENCYSTGIVSGASGYVGGLVGRNPGTVTASYYNSETSGQSDTDKGEPKTTAAMKNRTTFEDWDFVDIWGIDAGENDGYPYLLMKNVTTGLADILSEKWQIYPNPVKSELFISSDFPVTKAEIYSITGALLISEMNITGKINVSTLSPGVYMLMIYTNSGVVAKKVVKE